MRLLVLAAVVVWVPAVARAQDAGPADSAPKATNVDFSEGDDLGGPPDMITTRQQKDTEFETLMPNKYTVKQGQPEAPQGPKRRGGCSGCAAARGGEGGLVGGALAVACAWLLWRRRRALPR